MTVNADTFKRIQDADDLTTAYIALCEGDFDLSDKDRDDVILTQFAGIGAQFDPTTLDDVRAAVECLTRLIPEWCAKERIYEGYMGVVCATPAVYAYESITHFIAEGLDGEDAEAYTQRVGSLFKTLYSVA